MSKRVKLTVGSDYIKHFQELRSSAITMSQSRSCNFMINVGKFLNNQEFPNIDSLYTALSIIYNFSSMPKTSITRVLYGERKQADYNMRVYKINISGLDNIASLIVVCNIEATLGAPLSDEFIKFLKGDS